MSNTPKPISEENEKAAMAYALKTLEQMPKTNPEELEAHLVAMLVLYWGALWGTMGSEYATGFIESQLAGMAPGVEHERFTKQTH